MSSLLSQKFPVGNIVKTCNFYPCNYKTTAKKCYERFVWAERTVMAVIICTSLNILFHGVISTHEIDTSFNNTWHEQKKNIILC